MKPTKELIAALNAVAGELENGAAKYEWQHAYSCNCGLLARHILENNEGKEPAQAKAMVSFSGSWRYLVNSFLEKRRNKEGVATESCTVADCNITGLPMGKVFATLEKYGIELSDYPKLEYLMEGGRNNPKYNRAEEVAKYFRSKALELQSELDAMDPTVATPIRLDAVKFGVEQSSPVQIQQRQ